jgi:MGT family glycosyltransferase
VRFLLGFQPGAGHWSRIGAIALALKARGHHVALATSAAFHPRVDPAAADEVMAIGPSWLEDDLPPAEDPAAPLRERLRARSGGLAARFFAAAPQIAADLAPALTGPSRPDLAIFDYTLHGGPAAAARAGVRWAAVFGLTVPFRPRGWPPFGSEAGPARDAAERRRFAAVAREIAHENRTLYAPVLALWRAAGRRVRDPFAPYARAAAGIVGSIPACEFPRPRGFPRTIHYVGPLLGPTPAAPLDAEALRLLGAEGERPLVHVTLGLTFSRAPEILRAALRALAAAPVRVLVASGHLDATAVEAPQGAIVRPIVPHAAVLPRAAALVCHGGANTLMRALAAGVPSVIVPLGAEQRSNAARFARAGIARVLLPAEATSEAIFAAVTGLLDPASGFTARARQLALRAQAAGGAERAAALLERVCR